MTWNPKQSAAVCAAAIAEANHPADKVVTFDSLARIGQIPEEPDAFKMIVFRDEVTRLTLEQTGRYLKPLRGVGFTLLSSESSALAIMDRSLETAMRKIDKGEGRLRSQRQDVLSSGAREQNMQAQITLASINGTLKRYRPEQVDADTTRLPVQLTGPVMKSEGGA